VAVRAARIDALTGVPNRQAFHAAVGEAFRAATPERPLSLLCADIDHFKRVNDTYGHGVGDQVLAVFARVLEKVSGHQGRVFRIGGEEFAVVCGGMTRDGSDLFADHLLAAVVRGARVETDDGSEEVAVSCSIGIATHDGHEFDRPEALLKAADAGLYAAKAAGRSCARRVHQPPPVDDGDRRGHRPARS